MALVRLVHEVSFPSNPRVIDDYLWRRVAPARSLVLLAVFDDGQVEQTTDASPDRFDGATVVYHGWIGDESSHTAVSLAAAGYTLEAVS